MWGAVVVKTEAKSLQDISMTGKGLEYFPLVYPCSTCREIFYMGEHVKSEHAKPVLQHLGSLYGEKGRIKL